MTLAEFIKSEDIKPASFAAQIGVAPSTITRLIRDERSPRIGLIMKIQQATKGQVGPVDWCRPKAAE